MDTADSVSKIEVQYHRVTKRESEGAEGEYVIWEYRERLSIDRVSESVEFYREMEPGCTIKTIYHEEGGVSEFLDCFDGSVFSAPGETPPDLLDDPLETRDYRITVQTAWGKARTIEGAFDKYGLPEEWEDFITELFDLLTCCGFGEMFAPSVYGRSRHRLSDYIICNVQFGDGGPTYCYLADSDDYAEGDLVVVPAGKNNHEAVVRIDSIEYHSAGEAPYPIEKTKHILRKYEKKPDAQEDSPS